jgi:hypothetical protein
MNQKHSRDTRYVFIAAVLLILGLIVVQSQHWRAKSQTRPDSRNTVAQQRDIDIGEGRNLSGNWESDYSGSWKPATIRQEGNRLWFTNEFNDTSEGNFESLSRVKAAQWKLGATIQDGNTIKWDNRTTWRRRAEGNANIAGGWESDYSHSWKPATIRQEGNRLWFTNEFNDTSEGVFESSSRVSATKWKLGATIQDGNTIKWDNGTTWRLAGNPKCDDIKGHWWGWSGDNSGANFFIAPPNFPVDSPRIWAIGGFEVDPNNPNHADRWGEWECVGTNKFKLTNRRGGVYNTLTLRDGRLWQDDGRYACLNNAKCQ